jgi:hypothetical protein
MIVGAPNHPESIDEVFVFITTDLKTGNEGCAAFLQGLVWVPLITSDKSNLDLLRAAAKRIARKSGHKITLAKFSRRVDLETIE